jgi:hypothetical protein
MKAKTRVTNITVARLYNLGNYEHVRYEITAEVADGESAAETLKRVLSITQRLKPIKKPYDYDTAVEVLNKAIDQRTEMEKEKSEHYAEVVSGYNGLKALRLKAVEALDAIGGASTKTDAKLTWRDDEDDSECPW